MTKENAELRSNIEIQALKNENSQLKQSLEIEKSTYRLTTLVSLMVLHLDRKEEAKHFYEELLWSSQRLNFRYRQ